MSRNEIGSLATICGAILLIVTCYAVASREHDLIAQVLRFEWVALMTALAMTKPVGTLASKARIATSMMPPFGGCRRRDEAWLRQRTLRFRFSTSAQRDASVKHATRRPSKRNLDLGGTVYFGQPGNRHMRPPSPCRRRACGARGLSPSYHPLRK